MSRSIGRKPVRRTALAAVAALGALTLIGCGSDKVAAPPLVAAGAFKGTFVGSTGRGVLTITFPTADASAITGSLVVTQGATVPLTGSFSASANPQVSVTGGGYTVNGNYAADKSQFSGTYTGPNSDAGSWNASSGTVKVFCGSYSGGASGTWNLVLDGLNQLSGLARTSSGTIRLVGPYNTATGGITITSPDDVTVGATGTLNASTGAGSGTWSISGVNAGDWVANVTGC